MKLDKKEKLALVNVIDSVIQADSIVHEGEISALSKLMGQFEFNGYFIEEARSLDPDQGLLILNAMSYPKKKELAEILGEMSIADGFMHEKEIGLILEVLTNIGLGEELE